MESNYNPPTDLPKTDEPVDLLDRSWAVSASQLETFTTCQRKWAWEKVAGFASDETEATLLGGRVHKILEDYLEHGTLPDQSTREGEIATAGLHLLPPPKLPNQRIEFAFKFRSPRGNVYQGRKDFTLLPAAPGDIPLVGDHKTTSDFRWAKSDEDLRTNIQALIYAADELLRARTEAVDLEWIYYRTRGAPQARKTSLRILAEEVDKAFGAAGGIDDAADNLHRVRAVTTKDNILDLPASTDACNLFNRPCPHTFRCNLSPTARLTAVMAQGTTMGNLPLPPATNDLLGRLAAQATNPQAPTGIAPPPAPTALDAMRARMMGAPIQLPLPMGPVAGTPVPSPMPVQLVPPQAPSPAPQETPWNAGPPPAGTWYVDGVTNYYSCTCGAQLTDVALTHYQGVCPQCRTPAQHFPSFLLSAPVNPPEAALPPPVAAPQPTDVRRNTFPLPVEPAPPVAAPQPVPTPVSVPGYTQAFGAPPHIGSVTESTTSPQGVDKPKRHRRTKAEMEAARAAEAAGRQPVASFAERAATPGANDAGPIRLENVAGSHGYTIGRLLIDTLPIGQSCYTAEVEIFAPARAMVKEATGLDDYRLVDFGKGAGLFASAVMNVLENGSWDTVYVDSRSTDAMHAITVLVANAAETFRGAA